ncbi:hypothetical protein GOP47_0009859 [Adiantum capillus-veneris]|uniref:LSM domain-containing protein n=1 Tax=Adiantum capillus-veneris TaxID=13818 RepID=A0A9D4ZII8_ADICA|nr:hypothetical protein GOP47_0009263 [Adiantum capillus-veneris]KAI5075783.1 hypothetical protein GOP47_0009859 [Adiantum capillus-veneris]
MGLHDELGSLAMAASLELPETKEVERPLKARVRRCHQLLNRRMKVGVSDGRFFIGSFYCLDKQGNIILYDTLECRPIYPSSRDAGVESLTSSLSTSSASLEQRNLGLVLIPARCRTSCLVEGSLEEKLSLLSLQED